MTRSEKHPLRGELYWVNLDPVVGSEMAKTRPSVVLSNNMANRASPCVIVAPLTTKINKVYRFEVELSVRGKKGKVLLDQIRVIDKRRLTGLIAALDAEIMTQIDAALKFVLSLT